MERADELKERIRQQPLNDRLEESRRRIGDMCSKGRCPKMTIPVQHDDDDFYINTTLADAQATIAALQARVKECDAVIEKQVAILEEINKLDAERAAFVVDLKAQLTQRTAECDALKLVNDTHMKTVMKLSHVVEQRTSELEALKIHCAIVEEHKVIAYKDAANLQAELERVSLLSSHNERRFEEVDKKYKELRTLILTLPKVEGAVVVSHGYVKDSTRCHALFGADEDAALYAALLQHRQGMEG